MLFCQEARSTSKLYLDAPSVLKPLFLHLNLKPVLFVLVVCIYDNSDHRCPRPPPAGWILREMLSVSRFRKKNICFIVFGNMCNPNSFHSSGSSQDVRRGLSTGM